MYLPNFIFAPRSCQALPAVGRIWPSDDDDKTVLRMMICGKCYKVMIMSTLETVDDDDEDNDDIYIL